MQPKAAVASSSARDARQNPAWWTSYVAFETRSRRSRRRIGHRHRTMPAPDDEWSNEVRREQDSSGEPEAIPRWTVHKSGRANYLGGLAHTTPAEVNSSRIKAGKAGRSWRLTKRRSGKMGSQGRMVSRRCQAGSEEIENLEQAAQHEFSMPSASSHSGPANRRIGSRADTLFEKTPERLSKRRLRLQTTEE